jgi:hypothetical protein
MAIRKETTRGTWTCVDADGFLMANSALRAGVGCPMTAELALRKRGERLTPVTRVYQLAQRASTVRWLPRKNRTISALASGPRGSV